MSFLRRLALKSVMAAKKESVAKCAGPLQHGVGRQDGANTMIKTIQYLAELTTHESLLLLISKQPSKTCLGEPCCTASSKNDADLAAVFSKSYTGATEHRMHYDSANTKNSPTAGWIRVVLSTCGFSAAIDPVLRCPCWQTFAGNMTQAQSFFAYLGDWYLWIKPQCLLPTFALITAATRSVNLELQPSKIQIWRASCQDPIPAKLQDKVRLTPSCLGSISKFTATCSPGRAGLHGEDNTTLSENCHYTCRPQRRGTQWVVSERPTLHVCWCSKSARSAHEFCAHNVDRQVTTFWSAMSLLHYSFYPVWASAVQRHAAAWQSVIPTLMATTQ